MSYTGCLPIPELSDCTHFATWRFLDRGCHRNQALSSKRASHETFHDGPTLAPMTPPLATGTAPALGFAAAAKACGISESTLRRKRPELLAAGARQTPKGWSIPIPVLVELGLMDRTTAPDAVTAPGSAQESHLGPAVTAPGLAEMEPLMTALREKLADAEMRAAVAEAVAAERERIIEAQAQTLRMLEAPERVSRSHVEYGPMNVPGSPDREQQEDEPALPPRRRWWRR